MLLALIFASTTPVKTLLIGGSGYLGGAIAQFLTKNEIPFVQTYRNHEIPNGVFYDFFRHDISDVSQGMDTIIFAGEIEKNTSEEEKLQYQNRVQHFVTACSDKRVIYISSDGVFGGRRGQYSEDDIPQPKTKYGRNLKYFEEALQQSVRNYVIVRFSYLFGEYGDKTDKRSRDALTKLLNDETLEFASNIFRSPVEVNYVASRIVRLSQSTFEGIIHLMGQRKSVYGFYCDRFGSIPSQSPGNIIVNDADLTQPHITRDTSLVSKYTLLLLSNLTDEQLDFLPQANKQVLWGWKRDDGPNSRTVYFSSKLLTQNGQVYGSYPYLFYKHTCEPEFITSLYKAFNSLSARNALQALFGTNSYRLEKTNGDKTVALHIGEPSAEDTDRVTRLQNRTPRSSIEKPSIIPANFEGADLSTHFPADIYIGSGVSYEAGLPTLCHMHDHFGVDNRDAGGFAFGHADTLPKRLLDRPAETLRSFYDVHTKAITAEVTYAQQTIAQLFEQEKIGKVFTDNVDNLLCKIDLPFERTRGSGVFNEPYPAQFTKDTLIVIGVAADRRGIIEKARAEGKKIVIVDPCAAVSPNVQHLNYVKPEDVFYKVTAEEFFRKI